MCKHAEKRFRDNFYFIFILKNVHLAYPQSAGRKTNLCCGFENRKLIGHSLTLFGVLAINVDQKKRKEKRKDLCLPTGRLGGLGSLILDISGLSELGRFS